MGGIAAMGVRGFVRFSRGVERVGENLAAFRGRDADPENGLPAIPGVMVQLTKLHDGQGQTVEHLDRVERKIDATDRGNVEIMRRQEDARKDHEVLAGRVGRIETKVSQTLNAVTQ